MHKAAVTVRRKYFKRSVQDKNALGNHGCPQHHGTESFLFSQVGVSLVKNGFHLKSPEQLPRHFSGLINRKVFMVLLDQGNIYPDVQVRDERNINGNPAQRMLVLMRQIPQNA